MNLRYLKISLIFSNLSLMLLLSFNSIFGFFSAMTDVALPISTGSVNVIIENLQVENHNFFESRKRVNDSNREMVLNAGTLIPDSLITITFTVRNIGNSSIQTSLNIGLAWESSLGETGKFFLYPSSMKDEDIFADIASGRLEYAIIDDNVSDLKEIPNSTNGEKGIFEEIDNISLDYEDNKDYGYKLVLNEDEEISNNREAFEGKRAKAAIIASADVKDIKSNWFTYEKKLISFLCKTDFSVPVIEEVIQPKNFFISQAENINLSDYAIAVDSSDGIITDKIIITSDPQFDSKKAGTYIIKYEVENSLGKKAIPLEITIIIWNFVKIESGNYHSLALTSDGKVYSWGFNSFGQLGNGTNEYNAYPILVKGLDNITDIAAGTGCSFALKSDGQIYSWGRNDNGRLGDGTTTSRTRPTKVHQPNGVVFTQISARFNNAGAVTDSGDVYTWGYANYGASGNGSTVENHVPTKINLSNVKHLEMGYYNGAAITNDGSLYTWGDNLHGQLGNGINPSVGVNAPAIVPYFRANDIKIKDISVGWYHMAAVSELGDLYTWGYAAEGRLGNNLYDDKNYPQKISIGKTVEKAVAAYFHTAVMTSTGQAYFFGQNAYGKHGTGNTTNNWLPTLLNSVSNITDISLAYESSFVLTDSGAVYGMGYGGTGVLGTGNINNSNVAVKWAFIPPKPY